MNPKHPIDSAIQNPNHVREQRRKSQKPMPIPPRLQSFPLSYDEAQSYQKHWAEHYGVPVFTENNLGMRFAFIPPGIFMMGSPQDEPNRQSNENQHKVTLNKSYFVSVTPVTQAQWQIVMGNNPSRFNGENRPVDSVSWYDCQKFISKINGSHQVCSCLISSKPGKFAILTEAQWEYACRAGTITAFHSGDDLLTLKNVACHNSGNFLPGVPGEYTGKTENVGSLHSNAWGLHDMHGSVWEWCQDTYWDYPHGGINHPAVEKRVNRVVRGGSWRHTPDLCRSACRSWDEPGHRSFSTGCRICFNLD